MSATKLLGRLAALPAPHPGEGVFEPHVAIDPANPRRATVAAMYPCCGPCVGHSIWCWRTSDGGETWAGSRIPQAEFDHEGAADPVVAYGPDGALIVVAMDIDKASLEAFHRTSHTRFTSPTLAERMQGREDTTTSEIDVTGSYLMCIARSEDHGETWSSSIIPGSALGDKPALAIDRHPHSPHHGNIYIAWWDEPSRQLALARSTDGGRSAEAAILIGSPGGFISPQIAIGPNGTVHVLYSQTHWSAGQAELPARVVYLRSDDGGKSFSGSRVLADPGGWTPSLAAAPDGALLAAWSHADGPPAERWGQPRTTIEWVHSEDGEHWSDPAPLTEIAPDVAQGYPTVASTDGVWYVLSYDVTPRDTTVRIYSAGHTDLAFRPSILLATRGFGINDINLSSNYVLHLAGDIAQIGDYVGLSGAGSHLAAAIVLPEHDDWRSRQTGYAAILTEESEADAVG